MPAGCSTAPLPDQRRPSPSRQQMGRAHGTGPGGGTYEELHIPVKTGSRLTQGFFCSSLAPAGRDGAEPSARAPAPATGFPTPPRSFPSLMLKASLDGSKAATDRCNINGLLCKARCRFKCILITLRSSGTKFPGFQIDRCS